MVTVATTVATAVLLVPFSQSLNRLRSGWRLLLCQSDPLLADESLQALHGLCLVLQRRVALRQLTKSSRVQNTLADLVWARRTSGGSQVVIVGREAR